MNKESSHRSHELKSLGWNQEDILRYEELWEYCQRWGLINLEREDRQFLKKAEKLIPKLQTKKQSLKKSIEEKSYFLWLNLYLDESKNFNKLKKLKNSECVWTIILEEEIQLLKVHKPVMGLPDTIKAKSLNDIRKKLIDIAFNKYKAINNKDLFDFDSVVNSSNNNINKNWRSLVETDSSLKSQYPLISKEFIDEFRENANKEISDFMFNNYPSLKESL